MAYSKANKDKINYFKAHPEIVYQEYIVNKKSTYQLAEEWGLPKSTVYQLTKEAKLTGIKLSEKITSCNEDKFDIKNPIFCYMAGLASADAYLDEKNHRVTFRMAEQAKDILEYLREYFEVSNSVKPYNTTGYSGNITMYDLTISSQKLLNTLASLNIVGRKKDLGVRFPDMSKLSDECQEMYMRGLWDGDGTIRYNGTASIFEQSQDMISAIAKFVSVKLNIDTKITPRIKYNGVIGYDLYFSGKHFYDWMYRHSISICIKSKLDRLT